MPRPSITWIISDTHFHHNAMVTLCGRPPDFTARTIRNMRHVLAAQDILIHLGDVILYQYPTLKEILDSIPCTKVLVMGNHDRKPAGWYMRHGFAYAADMIVRGEVMFSHAPVDVLPAGVTLNVHGHLHNTGRVPPPLPRGERRLFCLENEGYGPVKLQSFLANCGEDGRCLT